MGVFSKKNNVIRKTKQGFIGIRRSAKKGTLMGFYSGIKINNFAAITMSSEGRRSQYRIDNDWALANEVIDIPDQYR